MVLISQILHCHPKAKGCAHCNQRRLLEQYRLEQPPTNSTHSCACQRDERKRKEGREEGHVCVWGGVI